MYSFLSHSTTRKCALPFSTMNFLFCHIILVIKRVSKWVSAFLWVREHRCFKAQPSAPVLFTESSVSFNFHEQRLQGGQLSRAGGTGGSEVWELCQDCPCRAHSIRSWRPHRGGWGGSFAPQDFLSRTLWTLFTLVQNLLIFAWWNAFGLLLFLLLEKDAGLWMDVVFSHLC